MIAALIFIFFVEIGFRIAPSLIPEDLLVKFHPDLRAEIGGRLGLPTLAETVIIDRDDNGPELRIPKPFTKRNWPDREPGIIDSTQMDQMGFCNPVESSYDEPSIELISLGDSFIWCTAIDPRDTWTSKLSSLSGYSTYNLAAPGTGVHEYVQIFKRFGIEKSPRFVIINIYEGTDLRDASIYEAYVANGENGGNARDDSDGEPNRPTSLPYDPCLVFHAPAQSFIGRYSYAADVLLVLAQNTCNEVSKSVTPGSFFPDEYEFQGSELGYRLVYPDLTVEFNLKNVGAEELLYANQLRSQEVDLEILNEPLKAFVDLSREHGFVPIVTYTPSAYTAYADNVVFDDLALSDIMPWFSRQQRDYFKNQGESLGYVFLDLTPFLQRAAQSTGGIQDLLYFRSNVHLTQGGHAIVAETINTALGLINSGQNLKQINKPE